MLIFCFFGVLFLIVTVILVLTKSNRINYLRYDQNPIYMWGTTCGGIFFGILFLIKSAKDLYYLFTSR
jgi:hypothetical protein